MDTENNRQSVRNAAAGMFSGKLLLVAGIVVLALIAFLCYFLFGNIHGSLTIEAGSVLNADDFLVMDWGVSAKITSDIQKVDMTRPGDYIVRVRYHGSDFYPTLHVKDTMAPVVTVKNVTVYSDQLPAPDIFMDEIQDSTPVVVSYVQEPDMSLSEQEVQLCVTDRGGNAVFTTARMKYVPDGAPPQIFGIRQISVYQGGTVSYENDVILRDDCDPAPVLTVNSDKVDLNTPGTYDVIYCAADAAGNTTITNTTITVMERTDTVMDEAVVYAKADEILDQITTENMTARQKVEAVYEWVRTNCTYGTTAENSDRLQSAYAMMTTGRGDSYNYYAVCSVFFERMGLHNMEVKRSEHSERKNSTHYWNLVSLDGGATYYHLDTCPQTGFDVRICLATDGELEVCNQYTPGYYTIDQDKYPATPLE